MTTNREVFFKDPTQYRIPNEGVTEVVQPRTPEQERVLRYELSNFVCKGEYKRGLTTILETYLYNLNKEKQPAVWISGFYGSGKSHFVRVLQHLWCDTLFPDGARARGLLTEFPDEISDLLRELTIAGKREGGLWAAAGTLVGSNVRLALLSILFRSADLPEQYALARFVLWLIKNGYYKDFRASIERSGRKFFDELRHLYLSPIIARALSEVNPDLASSSPAEVSKLLVAQFPDKQDKDISDDEMLHAIEDVLALQSTNSGKMPCTLIVLDELQQYIGQDPRHLLDVQNVVQICSSHFSNHILFVATGQAALQSTSQLSKLQGRFTVQIMLTDTDVEQVVREVVLRKDPRKEDELQEMLRASRGEIDRQLAGTKIAPSPADEVKLVSDYPLLPVRSRFWESFLREIDSSGTVGQLRTQLRIVHEAIREIADKPLGTVIASDVIYRQLKTNMLQSAFLSRDLATKIEQLENEAADPDGKLSARLCTMAFLIGKLSKKGEGITYIGVHATVETLADLLVDDITLGSTALRQRIPPLLQRLVESGMLMQVDDEYRIQTQEGQRWEAEYRRRYQRIQSNDARIGSDRTSEFERVIKAALKGISLTQGQSKTARKFDPHIGGSAPTISTGAVPIWVRDGWSVSEKVVSEDAQIATDKSPIIFVFLPYQDTDALKDALVSYAAANETLETLPASTTIDGEEARVAMESKRRMEQYKRDELIERVVNNARVYQGGGNELTGGGSSLQDSIRTALEDSLIRLFPKFSIADHKSWGTVATRARDGSNDPLSILSYEGNIEDHPACKEVLGFVDALGKKGNDIRKHFMGAGYGWSQDVVDGALLCLIRAEFVRATRNGEPVNIKLLQTPQIGQAEFYREGVTVSAPQKIAIRGFLSNLGLSIKSGEEAEAVSRALQRLVELANAAGGEAPLPARPSIDSIQSLQRLSGNEQLVAVYQQRDELLDYFKSWTKTGEKIAQRFPRWRLLERLLASAGDLPVAREVTAQVEAIQRNRSLLQDPEPVSPLITMVAEALRQALSVFTQRLSEAREQELANLAASVEWQRLSEDERQRLLLQQKLGPVGPLRVGTDEELLKTVNDNPISTWEDRIAALRVRMGKVREEAIQLQAPQTEYEYIRPPSATLSSADNVEAYLAQFRAEIMQYIEAGKTVVI